MKNLGTEELLLHVGKVFDFIPFVSDIIDIKGLTNDDITIKVINSKIKTENVKYLNINEEYLFLFDTTRKTFISI